MHKDFYASGFLYHFPSRQILLQQYPSGHIESSSWQLFRGIGSQKENPESIFQHIILKLLSKKIEIVYPVYSYPYRDTNKNHFIVYAKVRTKEEFSSQNGTSFAWFSFKQILKLHLAAQTEHDITVGFRVIDAAARKRRGEHTFQ